MSERDCPICGREARWDDSQEPPVQFCVSCGLDIDNDDLFVPVYKAEGELVLREEEGGERYVD